MTKKFQMRPPSKLQIEKYKKSCYNQVIDNYYYERDVAYTRYISQQQAAYINKLKNNVSKL